MAGVGQGPEIDPRWQRRLTVDEYHRMVDAGVFDEDDKLEMLEGIIVAMSPQNPPHAHVIRYLTRLFARGLGDEFDIRVQLPLTFARSEPEPDFAVADNKVAWARHPETAFLVVEVAGQESLAKDLGAKAALYAEAKVAEYWVVNVRDLWVEVMRDPDPAERKYRHTERAAAGEVLKASSLPEVAVVVAELFAWRRGP